MLVLKILILVLFEYAVDLQTMLSIPNAPRAFRFVIDKLKIV
jgi:hypothetical protein